MTQQEKSPRLLKLNWELVLINGFTDPKVLDKYPQVNAVLSRLFGERASEVHGLAKGMKIKRNADAVFKENFLVRDPSKLEIFFQEHSDRSTWRDLYHWADATVFSAQCANGGERVVDGPTLLVMETNEERTVVYDCWAFQNVSFNEFDAGTVGFVVKRTPENESADEMLNYGVQMSFANKDEHIDQDALGRFSAKVLTAIVEYEKNTGKPWDQHLSSLGINLADADVPSVLK